MSQLNVRVRGCRCRTSWNPVSDGLETVLMFPWSKSQYGSGVLLVYNERIFGLGARMCQVQVTETRSLQLLPYSFEPLNGDLSTYAGTLSSKALEACRASLGRPRVEKS